MNINNSDREKLTASEIESRYLQRPLAGGRLFVVSGPAGVGKDTVIEILKRLEPELQQVVTATTRLPRPGETPSVNYHFLSEAEFDQRAAEDKFLEWADVHGKRYGTPIESVREILQTKLDCLLKIDVQGALQVRRRAQNAILIYIGPPSIESLRRRLSGRGLDDPASLARRQADAEFELTHLAYYDYLVINPDDAPERAAQRIQAIIQAERSRIVPGRTEL